MIDPISSANHTTKATTKSSAAAGAAKATMIRAAKYERFSRIALYPTIFSRSRTTASPPCRQNATYRSHRSRNHERNCASPGPTSAQVPMPPPNREPFPQVPKRYIQLCFSLLYFFVVNTLLLHPHNKQNTRQKEFAIAQKKLGHPMSGHPNFP